MSFGDHLEELRSCLIRALTGLLACCFAALIFSKPLVTFLCKPLLVVQYAAGLEPRLQSLSVTGGFAAYLKVGLLAGLIVSMPWTLYQIWSFIVTGLYENERKFVRQFVPVTCVLFFGGVAFMYFLVLPLVLSFFIEFNRSFPLPDLTPGPITSLLVEGEPVTGEAAPAGALPSVPILSEPPAEPAPGSMWIDASTRRLCIMTQGGVWSVPVAAHAGFVPIQSEFAIDYYLSFVLLMMLAFGLGFELPVAVFFLAWTGIVPTADMAKARKYIILGIVIVAAVLTPPDVISQLMLAIPMYALFEGGLVVARAGERRRAAEPM